MSLAATAQTAHLSPRNREAPFCYAMGGTRTWPLLPASGNVHLEARSNGRMLAEGERISAGGVSLSIQPDGSLKSVSTGAAGPAFELEIRAGGERQVISIRPAAPLRPVTYYADFADDLINIFGAGIAGGRGMLHHELAERTVQSAAQRLPHRNAAGEIQFDAEGFDQYFRRLQCQGVGKLIVWTLPFPFLTVPAAYDSKDWDTFQKQAQAILASPELTRIIAGRKGFNTWAWARDIFTLRAHPEVHRQFAASARRHGISLAVSYRPFEPAVTKYYDVPAFDHDGTFLWSFLPLASPTVNFHAKDIGWPHYRELLVRMGQPEAAELTQAVIPFVSNAEAFLSRYRKRGDNLRIVATDCPPVDPTSLVLVRQPDGDFRLRPFHDLREKALTRRRVITGFDVRFEAPGSIVLTGLKVPTEFRFLLFENPSGEDALETVGSPAVVLYSRRGTPLGRTNQYWSLDDSTPEGHETRIAGITADGEYRPVFFASENSGRRALPRQKQDRAVLVVDRGELYSREMTDWAQPAARRNAINELRAILRHPGFGEIYINSRSHTQLAGSAGDGPEGIRPIAEYRQEKKRYRHLGVDLGHAPAAVASDASLREQAAEGMLQRWQPGEWTDTCQSEDCLSRWRYARNRAAAAGVRQLLQDLAAAFPSTPMRMVLPERAEVTRKLTALTGTLPKDTVSYTASRNNWIPNVGEGLALLDLEDLSIAPVLLGTGPFVDRRVLRAFLDEAVADMAGNRRSSYRGPLGIMWEGQWTLKNDEGRAAREVRACEILSRPTAVNELIVYEAADWVYRLPLDGWDFLGRCGEILGK
ncbi:MAG: hypothetical protein ACKV22_20045 [Bryobacteraceae bacterium]